VLQAPHRYGNSRAMWDHTVLPATRQGWHSRLYPTQLRLVLNLVTPKGCKAELTWLAWLHTEVLYTPKDRHPSQLRYRICVCIMLTVAVMSVSRGSIPLTTSPPACLRLRYPAPSALRRSSSDR